MLTFKIVCRSLTSRSVQTIASQNHCGFLRIMFRTHLRKVPITTMYRVIHLRPRHVFTTCALCNLLKLSSRCIWHLSKCLGIFEQAVYFVVKMTLICVLRCHEFSNNVNSCLNKVRLLLSRRGRFITVQNRNTVFREVNALIVRNKRSCLNTVQNKDLLLNSKLPSFERTIFNGIYTFI